MKRDRFVLRNCRETSCECTCFLGYDKPHFQERRWYELGALLFLVQNTYDHVRGGFATEYIFVRDGQLERRHGWQRVYTYSELRRLVEEAGFTEVEGYGSLAEEPFRLGSQRLYLTATRTG